MASSLYVGGGSLAGGGVVQFLFELSSFGIFREQRGSLILLEDQTQQKMRRREKMRMKRVKKGKEDKKERILHKILEMGELSKILFRADILFS